MAVAVHLLALTFTNLLLTQISGSQSEQKDISPVDVDVYYEALCPDSRRFFLKQLYPTYKKMRDDINLKLIAYGNAETRGTFNKWKFTCQHGPEECYGNTVQACAVEIMNNTMESLKFVVCAFTSSTQEKSISQCISDKGMQSSVQKCTDGKMGNNLLYTMGKLTDALNPPQTFIPWITINQRGSEEINDKANNDLFNLICSSYEGEKPPTCQNSKKRNILNNSYHKDAYL